MSEVAQWHFVSSLFWAVVCFGCAVLCVVFACKMPGCVDGRNERELAEAANVFLYAIVLAVVLSLMSCWLCSEAVKAWIAPQLVEQEAEHGSLGDD